MVVTVDAVFVADLIDFDIYLCCEVGKYSPFFSEGKKKKKKVDCCQ